MILTKEKIEVGQYKLHDLVETMLADYSKLDRRVYYPHYMSYHSPKFDGKCDICDAGALLAGTMGLDPDQHSGAVLRTFDFTNPVVIAVLALDFLRIGSFVGAYRRLYHNASMSSELKEKLRQIPTPVFQSYSLWIEYDKHMESMKIVHQHLKEIGV